MSSRNTTHSTIHIEHSYPSAPAKVFAAFADPVAKRRWFAESEGFIVDSFDMDFSVGGDEHAKFRFAPGTPLPAGTTCENHTRYFDIVRDRRIVIAYSMTVGGARISASLATFEFLEEKGGTHLVFTEQAAFFEQADGPELREKGWRDLLDRLASEIGD